MLKYIQETVDFLKKKGVDTPEIGIILGTGLGQLVNVIEIDLSISYNHIPNFPTATVEFHKGKLIFGTLYKPNIIGHKRFYSSYEHLRLLFI